MNHLSIDKNKLKKKNIYQPTGESYSKENKQIIKKSSREENKLEIDILWQKEYVKFWWEWDEHGLSYKSNWLPLPPYL